MDSLLEGYYNKSQIQFDVNLCVYHEKSRKGCSVVMGILTLPSVRPMKFATTTDKGRLDATKVFLHRAYSCGINYSVR